MKKNEIYIIDGIIAAIMENAWISNKSTLIPLVGDILNRNDQIRALIVTYFLDNFLPDLIA